MAQFKILFFSLFLLVSFSSCSKKMLISDARARKREKSNVAETYFTEGMKFYILEKNTDAIDQFKKAYSLEPSNGGLCYMLAKTYKKENKLNQALFFADEAVKLKSKNEYYYLLLAAIYQQQSNTTEAAKVYKKMLALFPDDLDNYLSLASIYLYQQKPEEAIDIYNKAEEKFGISVSLSRQKEDLYLKLNKNDLALEESKKLMEAFPDDNAHKLSYAELLVHNNKDNEAQDIVESIIQDEPDNPYAHYILANIYKAGNKTESYYKEMEQVFKSPAMELQIKLALLTQMSVADTSKDLIPLAAELITAHPDNSLAYTTYANMLLKGNKKQEAWKQLLKAKEIDDANYNTWSQLIILDSELKEIDSMVVHSEKSLEIYPNQPGLWYMNGCAYLLAHRTEDAIASFEQGKKLSGSSDQLHLQFLIVLGDSYNEIKDYKNSDLAYEEALKIDETNAGVLNNYSYFLALRNEKLDKALEMAKKLMVLQPENPAYKDTYAWVLYKNGKYREARTILEKVAPIVDDGTIVEHYGDVLFKLGEADKAVLEWIKAKKAGGASKLIDKKIADKKLYE